MSRDLPLASRLLLREWRAGELRIMLLALVIAVLVSTAISFFTDRLQRGMATRAAEFLGADMRISSREPLPQEFLQEAIRNNLQHTDLVDFSSVTSSASEMQLSSIKAVAPGYPLRGEVRTSQQPFGADQLAEGIPERGTIWIEPRLLNVLGLNIGDPLEIGYAELRIAALLTHEPDRAGDFYSLTPRVLMNLADLEATQVVQPGSRVRYRLLLSGSEADLQTYRQWLEPRLEAHQRLTSVADDNRQIGSALERANQFLGLASIAAVVLAGGAVALSASRFATRHYDTSALLRCLGASRQRTLRLFLIQLLGLGLVATLIGLLLGWFMQWGLVYLLRELLPPDLPPAGPKPLLVGAATGLIGLFGFALPPLLRLGRVSPLRVLRRELTPLPGSAWLIYGLALSGLSLLMWQFTGNLPMTLAVIFGGALAALLLGSLAWLLLRASANRLRNAGLAWRLGSGQLLKQPSAAAGQILAFGLILMSMVVIFILRTELLDSWQAQLPDDAPNHFALNILPEEEPAFRQALADIGARSAPLYPVTPGRLATINGEPVREHVTKDSPGERAINRDLSLTWAADLAADNVLREGLWWSQPPSGEQHQVSIEAELADSLGVALGDRLGFLVGGRSLDAEVTSIREVNWDNFTPNFYMVFSPGALDGAPTTLLTSFHLPPEQRDGLRELTRAFPAMTLLEVEAILQQLREILDQVTLAVEYVLVFVLLAGFTVLFASLQSTLDTRLYEGALLRTLGARRQLLRQANRLEFSLLGALAGLLAIVAAELITWLLYRFALNLDWQPHLLLWVLVPLAGALLIGVTGALGTRAVVNQSPMKLLNRGG
ncbi:putative ABC transporter permease [Pseudomonas saudimassiliensis]|uniref:Putative ABC transporter permease n=1 Tax=Pseudomonas saudimassiliensis TaxID=1461581 RepID=A0A078MLU1_9PSED|nr:FtsX-like permease family protein [Pseudomonas saudimassiliensis]CEA06402.1 putative ABC transporter permease [Pseudomonas saudimassiliensis]CEF27827.1 putative ABC transporter permease [Pseudomonas saudimassiliensis]